MAELGFELVTPVSAVRQAFDWFQMFNGRCSWINIMQHLFRTKIVALNKGMSKKEMMKGKIRAIHLLIVQDIKKKSTGIIGLSKNNHSVGLMSFNYVKLRIIDIRHTLKFYIDSDYFCVLFQS